MKTEFQIGNIFVTNDNGCELEGVEELQLYPLFLKFEDEFYCKTSVVIKSQNFEYALSNLNDIGIEFDIITWVGL